MKKLIIISIITIMFLLTIIISIKGIKIGNFKLESYKDIKDASTKIDNDLTTVTKLTGATYPGSVEELETLIKKFQETKQTYENKTKNSIQASEAVLSTVETYEIEFLWTIIGNYASKEEVNLTLDIVQATGTKLYNLNFKLTGSYVGMADFIYDIENDERLNFEIENIKMDTTTVVVNTDGTIATSSVASNTKTNTTNTNTNNTTNTIGPLGTSKLGITNTTNTNNNKTNTTNTNTNSTNTNTSTKTTAKQTTKEVLQTQFSVSNISINLD